MTGPVDRLCFSFMVRGLIQSIHEPSKYLVDQSNFCVMVAPFWNEYSILIGVCLSTIDLRFSLLIESGLLVGIVELAIGRFNNWAD